MNNDYIADKIEEAIGQMFANFRSQELGPTEYSIFYNPEKHSNWFIVIYFADNNTLKAALKQGICYQIHSYLINKWNGIPEVFKIVKSISFEFGNRPTEKFDIESSMRQLIAKANSQAKVAGKPDIKICGMCGHNFENHQLLCNLPDDKTSRTEGWIICPEENCTCFQTWSTNYKAENAKTDNKFG